MEESLGKRGDVFDDQTLNRQAPGYRTPVGAALVVAYEEKCHKICL